MEITKTIEAFIRERIAERAEKETHDVLAQLEKEAADAIKKWEAELKALEELTNATLANLATSYNYGHSRNSWDTTMPHILFDDCEAYRLPAAEAYSNYKKELSRKCDRAFKDIVVSMELGGSKQELIEMLDALKF